MKIDYSYYNAFTEKSKPFFQRKPDMLVVFGTFFSFLRAFILCFALHALHKLLLFDAFTERLHQIDLLHLLFGRIFQRILHPCVAFAANIYKHIAGGNAVFFI